MKTEFPYVVACGPGIVEGQELMEILIVSGFLGAGKTTLIRHLLTSGGQGLGKVAVLVNEIGEVGIDGARLAGRDVDIVELISGCICCTMKTDFFKAVQEIHQLIGPDFLVVESTGVAQPGDILQTLFQFPLSELCRVRGLVTVVDADFYKAKDLLGSFYEDQIRFADVIILNKTDLVGSGSLSEIEVFLQEINPVAMIFPTQHGAVDLSLLLQEEAIMPTVPAHDEHGHADLQEWGFEAFSYTDDRPADKEKLTRFLESLPPTLFRLKGWVRISDASLYLDYTGGHYRMEPVEGPRSTALTFVGQNCNQTQILDALKGCFLEEPFDP